MLRSIGTTTLRNKSTAFVEEKDLDLIPLVLENVLQLFLIVHTGRRVMPVFVVDLDKKYAQSFCVSAPRKVHKSS